MLVTLPMVDYEDAKALGCERINPDPDGLRFKEAFRNFMSKPVIRTPVEFETWEDMRRLA